jgi:hypothetical protein
MKIIDIAICIDNIDPKGMGRIRCVRYSDYVSEKEGAYTYIKWSEIDPFIAIPFLPININYIPEIGQAIKIINYDTDKETVNQEYISGPFTTSFDFNNQKFTNQLENTTYGSTFRKKQNIINSNGDFINNKSNNLLAKNTDFAIYGKFGNDIIFTKNGLNLRAGKIDTSVYNNKQNSISPNLSENIASVHLKKYESTLELSDIVSETSITESAMLNYVIEYELETLTNPTKILFYIYKVIKKDDVFKTDIFNVNTDLIGNCQLINNEPITIDINSSKFITIGGYNTSQVVSLIRNKLFELYDIGIPKNLILDLTPFYFRPSKKLLNLIPNSNAELQLKNDILNNVNLLRIGPNNGLIWSKNETSPPSVNSQLIDYKLKVVSKTPQTFSSITSDKIYLLSSKANKNTINFNVLNKYEYTQEDYLKLIDVNTFSLVRGENLIEILKAMLRVLFNHRHNLTKPMVKIGYDEYDSLIELIKTMENDLLNNSIKIN